MDKSKPSHIERTVYVSPDVTPGSSLRYGDWRDTPGEHTWYADRYETPGNVLGRYVARAIPLTLIDCAVGSDYSGNLVEASNARCLKRDFPWLVEVYGGHGTFGVAYLGRRENQSDALIEAIDSLASYPVYDESDHSELECERESEAWSEDGEQDFCKALASYLDEIDEDHEHEITDESVAAACLPRRYYPEPIDTIWDLWREGCEAFNVNGGSGYVNEQGDSIYFYIDEWIEDARKPAYPSWPDTFKAVHENMRESLLVLAHFTRIPDDDQPATQET